MQLRCDHKTVVGYGYSYLYHNQSLYIAFCAKASILCNVKSTIVNLHITELVFSLLFPDTEDWPWYFLSLEGGGGEGGCSCSALMTSLADDTDSLG